MYQWNRDRRIMAAAVWGASALLLSQIGLALAGLLRDVLRGVGH